MAEIYHRIPGFTAALKNTTSSAKTSRACAPLSSAADASKIFNELSRLLGLNGHELLKSLEKLDLKDAPSPIRNLHLPHITILKLDALALGLPSFPDEPLEMVAFGNVSPDNYVDLFWEAVKATTAKGSTKKPALVGAAPSEVAVYEVEGLLEPRILLNYREQLFRLSYIRADDIVREYPAILNVHDSFLDDLENDHAQRLVKKIQAGEKVRERLDEHECIREAYAYIKRWARVRGINKILSDQKIFQLVQNYQSDISERAKIDRLPAASNLVREFFNKDAQSYDPLVDAEGIESQNMENWESVLIALDSLRFYEKMIDFPQFVRVAVTYSGPSRMKGGEWISMVERRITKLEERLNKVISKGSVIRMWPQRLARQSSADDTVYEGSFVVGLSLRSASEDLEAVRKLADKSEEQVREDRATIEGCFIRVLFESQSDVAKEDLENCTTTFPRKTMTGDERSNQRNKKDGITPTKQKKKEKTTSDEHQEHEKSGRFRTAAEVHNRLKYDESWDIDEFVLGYIDRHNEKIVEKPAGDWVRETTAEEFIPEHRIEYFKKAGSPDGEFVWHKSLRVDTIFKHSDS